MDQLCHVTATESAYLHVRQLIMDAQLLPNSRNLEITLADRLGHPMESIHGASLRLDDDGLVEACADGTFWVLPLSAAKTIDVYLQLAELEQQAVILAAEYGPPAIQLRALDDAVATMYAAFDSNDLTRWARSEYHFHRSLVTSSQDPLLVGEVLALSQPVHRARMVTLRMTSLPVDSIEAYASVIEAIRLGDPTTAANAQFDHWLRATEALASVLSEYGLAEEAVNVG